MITWKDISALTRFLTIVGPEGMMNIFHRGVGQEVFERVGARNAALIKTIALGLLAVSLAGCMGYVPGRQTYWDAQVKEMCEKDGGVTVYERVKLTRSEYQRLGGTGNIVPVPSRGSAGPDYPFVADTKITKIRESNPEVYRRETTIVRIADGKVLSRQVQYGRIGGDFPSPAHRSSYGCSEVGLRLDVERQTFEIAESAQ